MSSIHSRVYRNGLLTLTDTSIDEALAYLDQANAVVIVDLLKPSQAEVGNLAELFDLHDIAVDDISEERQRPKLARYDTHLGLTLHTIALDPRTHRLDQSPLNVFFGGNWVITIRGDESFPLKLVYQTWEEVEPANRELVAFFLYSLLATILDSYDDTADAFSDYFDQLSEQVFSDHPISAASQHEWFLMRRALMSFHRILSPTRELLNALMYRSATAMPERVRPYYQDLYDHTLTLTESTEALRDLATGIADANLSLRDYRQNQIMKQVTSWAAILAVPTLITGYYGMNLPFPGYQTSAGFVTAVSLIVLLSLLLFGVFRRKDWL